MFFFFLIEPGIRVWEGLDEDPVIRDFKTLTLVTNDPAILIPFVATLFESLVVERPVLSRWYTTRASAGSGKVEALLRKRDLEKPLPGFRESWWREDDDTGILYGGARLVTPFDRNHFDVLNHSGTFVVAWTRSLEDLDFGACLKGAGEKPLSACLVAHPDMLLGRGFESDTHAVWQFIGRDEALDRMAEALHLQGVRRLTRKSEAAEWMRE